MANKMSTFAQWVDAVDAEGARVLGRGDADMTWFIGGIEDMRPAFADGVTPEAYIRAQLEKIYAPLDGQSDRPAPKN